MDRRRRHRLIDVCWWEGQRDQHAIKHWIDKHSPIGDQLGSDNRKLAKNVRKVNMILFVAGWSKRETWGGSEVCVVANGKVRSPPISIPGEDWHTPDGLLKFVFKNWNGVHWDLMPMIEIGSVRSNEFLGFLCQTVSRRTESGPLSSMIHP